MRTALILLAAAPLAAAVPGVPEPGPGLGLPDFSLTTQNDMFASGLGNRDDYRTAGLDAQGSWDGWVLSASGSMLTDRGLHSRSDQAVLLAGRQGALGAGGAGTQGWRAAGWVGAGAQFDRRLGGQEVQNWIHRNLVGATEVHEPYDRARGGRGALAAAGAVGGFSGGLGLELVAAGLAVESGEALAEIGPRFSLVAAGGGIWVGPRWRLRDGDAGSPTAARTLAHEDGCWVDLGAWVAPGEAHGEHIGWQAHAGYDLQTRAASGSFGVLFFPARGLPLLEPRPDGKSWAIEHEVAYYSGGGMGVQARFDHAVDGKPVEGWAFVPLVLDYRYGTDPGGRLHWALGDAGVSDADLRHDMITGGCEVLWRSGDPTWRWLNPEPLNVHGVLAVQAGAGVRSEGVVAETAGAHELRARATAIATRGALDARLELGRILILGFSLDGWLPWWDNAVTRPDGRVQTLNDPGLAWGLHLGGRLAW